MLILFNLICFEFEQIIFKIKSFITEMYFSINKFYDKHYSFLYTDLFICIYGKEIFKISTMYQPDTNCYRQMGIIQIRAYLKRLVTEIKKEKIVNKNT